jgi:hypothetical protein
VKQEARTPQRDAERPLLSLRDRCITINM